MIVRVIVKQWGQELLILRAFNNDRLPTLRQNLLHSFTLIALA